jgi:hypothetical protein
MVDYFRFYYAMRRKKSLYPFPIKAIRMDGGFINPDIVPRVVAFPVFIVKEKQVRTKPKSGLWEPYRMMRMKMLSYPNLETHRWFTYRKDKKTGKLRKLTMAAFLAKENSK